MRSTSSWALLIICPSKSFATSLIVVVVVLFFCYVIRCNLSREENKRQWQLQRLRWLAVFFSLGSADVSSSFLFLPQLLFFHRNIDKNKRKKAKNDKIMFEAYFLCKYWRIISRYVLLFFFHLKKYLLCFSHQFTANNRLKTVI